jgi:phage gp36-like protein
MTYASQADIEARYPGELDRAGPKTAAGALVAAAVTLALVAAADPIDRALRTIGWSVPLVAPIPGWVIDLVVDIALYLVTPTVLASQEVFKDRRKRYETALGTLMDIASGKLLPPPLASVGSVATGIVAGSNPRLFGRGVL